MNKKQRMIKVMKNVDDVNEQLKILKAIHLMCG